MPQLHGRMADIGSCHEWGAVTSCSIFGNSLFGVIRVRDNVVFVTLGLVNGSLQCWLKLFRAGLLVFFFFFFLNSINVHLRVQYPT
jgi:hypothetical protein